MQNNNNNFKNGYNIRSKFWQDYKKSICDLSPQLFNIAIGCMLGLQKIYLIYNSKEWLCYQYFDFICS
jgi:hypothetical protein